MTPEEDEEELYFCDSCGQEFETRNALEGHESEGCWAE
jgi:DNA-directed RNA polymerase subunit RPC12/RpoP